MTLWEVLEGIEVVEQPGGTPDLAIRGVTCQPNTVEPGVVFAACRVPWLNGASALRTAVARGATAILMDEWCEPAGTLSGSAVVRVRNVNQAYAAACGNFSANAHRGLTLYGVTGTKGKTTTCHVIEAVLRHAGYRTGLISTIVRRTPECEWVSSMTTPEPAELHRILLSMRSHGVTHVVVEVSSIGLTEERVFGLQFDGVVFTNLGHEHLSYHAGMDDYIRAKSRLFEDGSLHSSERTVCVINADDAVGANLAQRAVGSVLTYGIHRGNLKPTTFHSTELGTTMRIGDHELRAELGGIHNVYNLLAALALTQEVVGVETAIRGLSNAPKLPGRLERVRTGSGIDVFVDYAHTPESVKLVLQTFAHYAGVRPRAVVVGCGGGTDESKRAAIAQTALAGCDCLVLTADNPRFEDPIRIIQDMVAGLDVEALVRQGRLHIIPNRKEAIRTAIRFAVPTGVVVVLGKGHERAQAIQGRLVPFDDREVARNLLRDYEA